MKFDEFKRNVINWAKERKIIPNSNNKAQYIKLIEELGELALGIRKRDKKLIKDAIGDIAIVLIVMSGLNDIDLVNRYRHISDNNNFYLLTYRVGGIGLILDEQYLLGDEFKDTLKSEIKQALYVLMDLARELKVSFFECCELAWNEIKDRKGILREDGIFVKEADLGGEND
jgi:phosphoribosyl-ATP pyrophosphohydrolase